MTKRSAIIIGALVALTAVVAATAFAASPARRGTAIRTAIAETTDLSSEVSASGEIVAGIDAYADVYPPVAGTLAAVWVKDRQHVRAGQRLAKLDTDPIEQQISAAKTARAQASSALSTARRQASSAEDIKAAQDNVTAMTTLYDNAKRAYAVASASARAGQGGTDAAEAAMRQAKAALTGAKASLAKARQTRSVSEQQVASEAARRQADDAEHAARKYLAGSVLVSPIDGVVMFNATSPQAGLSGRSIVAATGSAVSPAAAPFSVVDLSRSVFSAEVDEADAGRLVVGGAAVVTLDAFPGREIRAKVTRIDPSARKTPTGGTVFATELSLENPMDNILIGMKGDAEFAPAAQAKRLSVPADAFFTENGGGCVYLVESGRLRKTNVVAGAKTDSRVEIVRGLRAGDVVALAGSQPLADGMAVSVRR